jgi:hypothetical protein
MAANDAGLVFVLLNANPGTRLFTGGSQDPPLRGAGEISRGTIIPTLVGAGTSSRALAQAQRLPALRFAPFRLLIIDRDEMLDCWPEGERIRHRRRSLDTPVLRTSSSLGDAIVMRPRRTLFRQLFNGSSDARVAQDRFHEHRWPCRGAISVNMSRLDARTVSHTVVEVRSGSVTMSYRAANWPHAIAVQVAA